MSVQEKINRLLWDRRLILLPKDMDVPEGLEYVVLHDLKLEDRNYYLFIRDLEEQRARGVGVPTEGEMMDAARKSGYWGPEDDDIEQRADDHIAFLQAEFEAKAKFKSRQNIIKVQIADAKAKKDYVTNKRNDLKRQSAEYLAHEIASSMLLRRVAFRPDGKKLAEDEQDYRMLKEHYPMLWFYLIFEMMNEGVLENYELREIARSTEWRLTWVLCRENLPTLFDRSIGDFTINHKMLVYWSRIYDIAFENPNPPEQEIINDDQRFDDWMANREFARKEDARKDTTAADGHQERGYILDGEYVEQCNCGAKANNVGKGRMQRQPHATTCPYGTWRDFTPQEKEERARRVYGRNPNNVRKILDAEHDRVLKQGMVEEQHLRGKKTRTALNMQQKVIPIRRQ
jgi:hypothetical protein